MVNKCLRLFKLLISVLIRSITTIKSNRIICWSYSFTKYSCNPKYISEYLLQNYDNKYEIFWVLRKGIDNDLIDKRIKLITFGSLKYFFIINTSKIIIANSRIYPTDIFWVKKKNQKYIMTWHASMGIKKLDKDAESSLSKSYIKKAKYDSSICDLLISGSKFRTEVFKHGFYYDGEILEVGTPRNDILFLDNQNIKEKIYRQYNIDKNSKIVLYAPTFRADYNLKYYDINWDDIKIVLKEKFKDNYIILIRLHPNLSHKNIDMKQLFNYTNIVDVTKYHDMQELLVVSDILITDYSSSMFDFSLLHKPCFLYVRDIETYDRGYYLNPYDLPFPIAISSKELVNKILSFDKNKYVDDIIHFNTNIIGTYETGVASQHVCKWIESKCENDHR